MHLLLVSPSGSYRSADYLEAALRLGCQVTVATDAEPAIPGTSIPVDLHHPTLAAEQLVAMVGPIDGVVGTDGPAVAVAGEVARRLGLAANAEAALATARDKLRQRRCVRTAGVAQPNFAAIEGDTVPAWSDYPAVVKPLDRAASQGVIRVKDDAELRKAITTVRTIVGSGAPLLVEAFVPGVEIAVEAILRAGQLEVLATFDKPDTPQGPTFPETLLISPARLEPTVLDQVVAMVGAALRAVGLTEGPVHVEGKVDGANVWFLELAARTIGGWCSRSLRPGGITLEELVIRHALGLALPTFTAARRASGALMVPVPRSGQVRAVLGVERAAAVPGVTEVAMSVGVGEHVEALPAGDRYLGFVFATAAGPDEVEAALRTAWSALTVTID
ncbi:MAG: ATP-grasp domain-containing protein [Acidimicrobiales bacterium]